MFSRHAKIGKEVVAYGSGWRGNGLTSAHERTGFQGVSALWCICLCLLAATVSNGAVHAQASQPPGSDAADAVVQHSFVFPRARRVDGFDLIVHAPQIRSWPGFERFAAMLAVELTPPDGSPARYATATVQGATEVDLADRVVRVIDPEVTNVRFTGAEVPEAYRAAVMHATRDGVLEVPLDLFLASVADDVLSNPPPPGFNVEPPAIVVKSKPTLLLFVNGEPVGSAIADTGLEVLVNANWPVFRTVGDKPRYYLLDRERWYVAKSLDKGWKPTRELPAGFTRLPDEPEFAAVRAAVPAKAVEGKAPPVIFAAVPTELIVTDGKADLEEIPGTGGLQFVANTESPLFKLEKQWYYLAAGRWFTTSKLDKGPWTYAAFPPHAFQAIPADHEVAVVRASVPGTVEAKMAALEALLPTKVTANVGDSPVVTVDFAGEPLFEPIAETGVSRAVNTSYDVLQVEGRCYLLHGGIWYEAPEATGPWTVAASVPDAIYTIPPSSPAYHVTQVTVASTTPETVTYSYPSSYSSSTYVVYGVPYYGTGWYYAPWIYGDYYYPYWGGAYGHGSWYNPATGGYGSRSVWYGPYGGYSYTQGYNPATGRYGFVETAWDGDEWGSHGETFNPRTGVGTETDRYYNADSNRSEMERTTSRGDEWVNTRRETDFDTGTSNVERETSRGGSSEMQRQRTEDGISSEGSITTGNGNEFDVSREWSDGERTSTITGDSGSITTETRRQNGNSVTAIEGSGGGQGLSVSGENGRTTIGQSGSGDIYAGHNGDVYKRTEGGWQEYENGGWQDVERPQRGEGGAGNGATAAQRPANQAGLREPGSPLASLGQQGQPRTMQELYGGARSGSLDRDYDARQRSQRQYQQRNSASHRGSFERGGGSFRGMGGGGFRGRGGGRRR
jgi:hypothetical protein